MVVFSTRSEHFQIFSGVPPLRPPFPNFLIFHYFQSGFFLLDAELNSKNFLLMISRAKMSLGRDIHDTVMMIFDDDFTKPVITFFRDNFMTRQ